MCEAAGEATLLIRGIRYNVCPRCGKPISGTGRSMGGVAIFVLKAFVRAGKIVDFPDQWLALCEQVGFRLVCRHRAMLVKYRRKRIDLFGDEHVEQKKRSSLFRHLQEIKAAARVFWPSLSEDAQVKWMADAWTVKGPAAKEYRVLEKAQVLAYQDAGEPQMDSPRIEFEEVLCLEKS